MGTSKTKVIQLSEGQLQKICNTAAEKAVERYIRVESDRKNRATKGLLYNTKVLLNNYQSIKSYLAVAKYSLSDIVAENSPDGTLETLEAFGLTIADSKSYSIARSVSVTTILIGHVDRMLETYRERCQASCKETIRRRWDVINMQYLQSPRMAPPEIAEALHLDPRSVQRDSQHAIEELKVLFFGSESIIPDLFS